MLNVGFLSNLTFQSHADQVAGAEGGLKTRMEVSPQKDELLLHLAYFS